jgi:hypothetical protein
MLKLGLHVLGRGKNPLTVHIVQGVKLLIDQADGQVGHPDFIQIGVGYNDPKPTRRIFAHHAELPADIPAGFLDAVEDTLIIGLRDQGIAHGTVKIAKFAADCPTMS